MSNIDSKLILLSAGGTGGHLTPALALAHDLKARGFRVGLVTDGRAQKCGLNLDEGITIYPIQAGTLGSGLVGKIKGLAALALGMVQAWLLVGRLKPAVVVGFGGYPSFPAVYAAQGQHIPTIIHEQNAILGKANTMLAHKADRIALSYPESRGLEAPDQVRAVFTGNPVRAEIAALFNQPYPAVEDKGALNLFIMGGSLGARVFSDVIPAALAGLPEELRIRLVVSQQCRADDVAETQAAYDAAAIQAECAAFFNDVDARLATTHLFIGRSGAGTAAEIAVAGRPAIFVPYPYHKDQQQKINAQVLAEAGGAWLMSQDQDFTADALRKKLADLFMHPQKLFDAAEAARACGRPDAARRLGNLVTALASGWQ